MWATKALTPAVAAVTSCLALAACGGDDHAASGGATTAKTATAAVAPGTASGLGGERFRALDAVYLAQLPIDELGDDADAARFQAAAKPLLAACDALDEQDPLLGPFRRTCPVLTRFTEQLTGFASCGSEDDGACEQLIADVRRTLSDFGRLSRRSDAAVDRATLSAACKRALATPEPVRDVIARFERAFALLARGATGEAGDALAAAHESGERLPKARAARDRFRSGCG